MKIKNLLLKIVFICGLSTMACGIIGCEAFVRKFTRKPKNENIPREEMILVPIEYKAPAADKDGLYRQYFLYWKSWHEEFINSLFRGMNRRKQLECVTETIKNLEQLRGLLKEESQRELSVYIGQINGLKDSIEKDAYGIIIESHRRSAERIERDIIRKFSYNKIKDQLKYKK